MLIKKMPIDKFGRSSFTRGQSATSLTQFSGGKFLKHNTPLNMEFHAVQNLPFPNHDTDAANRRYVDDKIDHLEEVLKKYIDIKLQDINTPSSELEKYK